MYEIYMYNTLSPKNLEHVNISKETDSNFS